MLSTDVGMPGLRDIGAPAAPPAKEKVRGFSTRELPADVADYLDTAPKRGQAKMVFDAIRLDRDINGHLKGEGERLRRYAEAKGLSLKDDLARVLAELVLEGLDCLEHETKAKPKSNNGHGR